MTIGLFGQEIDDDKKIEDSSFITAMNFFKDTAKTEASFFLRFQVMPDILLKTLESYYNTDETCKIFKEILFYYNVKKA